jgi:DNA-binding FadR family transcriptional regulator
LADIRRRRPAHLALAQRLGIAIVTGRHQPGSILPGEIELADNFGVSRSVIRESLRMLTAKGLVESRPKIGTRVRERAAWNLLDPELLGWMFEGAPPLGFVRSLFQLRMIVEPAAAELAAELRSARQIGEMGYALETMSHHGLATDAGRAADQHRRGGALDHLLQISPRQAPARSHARAPPPVRGDRQPRRRRRGRGDPRTDPPGRTRYGKRHRL